LIVILTLSLSDERLMYEAIYRHCEHLANLEWGSSDAKNAARIAIDAFPQLGYPVPQWVTDLAES
jgi:hypothetical protein